MIAPMAVVDEAMCFIGFTLELRVHGDPYRYVWPDDDLYTVVIVPDGDNEVDTALVVLDIQRRVGREPANALSRYMESIDIEGDS